MGRGGGETLQNCQSYKFTSSVRGRETVTLSLDYHPHKDPRQIYSGLRSVREVQGNIQGITICETSQDDPEGFG